MALNGFALTAVGWVAWDTYTRGVFEGVGFERGDVVVESLDLGDTEVDIESIVRLHLFGREPRNAAPVVRKAAPPTRLNLKLVGVIAIGSDSAGLALIESGRGQQDVIRVGEPIGTTDARLAEVWRDHVLIERNGQLEKLAIDRPHLEESAFRALDDAGVARASLGADTGNENLPLPSEMAADPAPLPVAETAPIDPDTDSQSPGTPLPGSESVDSTGGATPVSGPTGDLVLPFATPR